MKSTAFICFLLGFLANSIGQRIFGNVPSDDIIWPVAIFVLLTIILGVKSYCDNHPLPVDQWRNLL